MVLQKFFSQKEENEQNLRFSLAVLLPSEPCGSMVLQKDFTDTRISVIFCPFSPFLLLVMREAMFLVIALESIVLQILQNLWVKRHKHKPRCLYSKV